MVRYFCFRNTERTSKILNKGNVWNRGASINHPSTKYEIAETKGMEGKKDREMDTVVMTSTGKERLLGKAP